MPGQCHTRYLKVEVKGQGHQIWVKVTTLFKVMKAYFKSNSCRAKVTQSRSTPRSKVKVTEFGSRSLVVVSKVNDPRANALDPVQFHVFRFSLIERAAQSLVIC